MTRLHPVLARELDRALVRLGPAAEKLDGGVLLRGDPDQAAPRVAARRIGRHGRRGERDLPRLLGRDVDDLVEAMAEIDGEDAGKPIDVGFPKTSVTRMPSPRSRISGSWPKDFIWLKSTMTVRGVVRLLDRHAHSHSVPTPRGIADWSIGIATVPDVSIGWLSDPLVAKRKIGAYRVLNDCEW